MNSLIEDIITLPAIKDKLDESGETLRATELQLSAELFNKLGQLRLYLQAQELGGLSFRLSSGDNVDFARAYESYKEEEPGTLVVQKKGCYFFTEKGFKSFLTQAKNLSETKIVRLHFAKDPFTTPDCAFLPLENPVGNVPQTAGISENLASPMVYVKVIGIEATEFFPDRLESWTVTRTPDTTIPGSFASVAAAKLIAALCTEFVIDNRVLKFEFKGDNRKGLHVSLNDGLLLGSVFAAANNMVKWVYSEERDINTKHTFLNQNLILLLGGNDTNYSVQELQRIFDTAAENSRHNFEYYLQGISRDVQKNFIELNKTLLENVAKIRQNTADLGTSLWKDFTTVIGVLLLNFAVKKNDIIAVDFSYFAYGLCVYVAISYTITAYNGFWFYSDLHKNVLLSRDKLYSYMAEDEFNNLVVTAIIKAFTKFRVVFFVVLVAYLVVIYFVLRLTPGFDSFIGSLLRLFKT